MLEHATVEAAEFGCVRLLGVLKAVHGPVGEEEAKHACMHTPQPVSTPPQEIGLPADLSTKSCLQDPPLGEKWKVSYYFHIQHFPAGEASPDWRQGLLLYGQDF